MREASTFLLQRMFRELKWGFPKTRGAIGSSPVLLLHVLRLPQRWGQPMGDNIMGPPIRGELLEV